MRQAVLSGFTPHCTKSLCQSNLTFSDETVQRFLKFGPMAALHWSHTACWRRNTDRERSSLRTWVAHPWEIIFHWVTRKEFVVVNFVLGAPVLSWSLFEEQAMYEKAECLGSLISLCFNVLQGRVLFPYAQPLPSHLWLESGQSWQENVFPLTCFYLKKKCLAFPSGSSPHP